MPSDNLCSYCYFPHLIFASVYNNYNNTYCSCLSVFILYLKKISFLFLIRTKIYETCVEQNEHGTYYWKQNFKQFIHFVIPSRLHIRSLIFLEDFTIRQWPVWYFSRFPCRYWPDINTFTLSLKVNNHAIILKYYLVECFNSVDLEGLVW